MGGLPGRWQFCEMLGIATKKVALGGSSRTCLREAFRVLQESQVLLTLTNPVENLTHVTLVECEEGDPDNINSTAKVGAFCLILMDPYFSWRGLLTWLKGLHAVFRFHIQVVIRFFWFYLLSFFLLYAQSPYHCSVGRSLPFLRALWQ